MISKRFIPSAWFRDIPTVHLLKVHSKGVDYGQAKFLQKHASSDMVMNIDVRPVPNHSFLHLITMGAGEYYGCFFKGAPVQTPCGFTPIEDLQEGDLVMTHKGRYRPVTDTFKDRYEGTKVSLKVCGIPEKVESTGNHPFLVIRKEDMSSGMRCHHKKKGSLDAYMNDVLDKAHFVDADTIVPGDIMITPIGETGTSKPDFPAYLLGLYVADGCLFREYRDIFSKGSYKGVVYTLGLYKDPCIDAIQEWREQEGKDPVSVRTNGNSLRVEISHREFSEYCHMFGAEAHYKKVPPMVFDWCVEDRLNFLAGYLDGDGCRCSGKEDGGIQGSTVSLELVSDLRRLCASVGIPFSSNKGENKEENGCYGNTSHIYEFSIPASFSGTLNGICRRLKDLGDSSKRRTSKQYIVGNNILSRVSSVDHRDVVCDKYNVEVEEDNTYVVLVAGHNSNNNADWFNEKRATFEIPEHHSDGKPRVLQLDDGLEKYHRTFMKYGAVYNEHNNSKKGGPEIGSIHAEWYNPVMHRGELVVKLPNARWSDDLQKLANGGHITWSMGCFCPGALVTMSDYSQVPIEDVSAGSSVIMHNGESAEVIGVRKLDYEDVPIYSIRQSGGLRFECTPNHPFFVLRKEQVMFDRRFRYDGNALEDGSWENAEDLEEGDYFVLPLRRKVREPESVSESFARLCGYYLAGGYVYNKKREPAGIRFRCHDILRTSIENTCKDIGTKASVWNHLENSDKASIEVCDKDLAEQMLLLFGSGEKEKFLNPSVFGWSEESLCTFLRAYREGGGDLTSKLAVQLQILSGMSRHPLSVNNHSHVTQSTGTGRRVVGDFLLIKIEDIGVDLMTTSVYNIEVDSEHHSYLVNGVATHNCGVPYDICSWCGNFAKTKKDYCDHLKYQKMSLSKEGHQACAINDQPHFHDISRVRVPAFRAAYTLAKVASEGVLPAADDPDALWLPLSMIGEIGDKLEQKHAAAFRKAAEIEKEILAKGMSAEDSGLANAFQDNGVDEEIVKELQQYPTGDVLAALNKREILLPPNSFCRIILRRPESEIKGIKDLPCCVKKVFSELADSGDNDVFSDSSYVPLSPRHWTGLEETADKLVDGFSTADGPVQNRIIKITIKGGPSLSKRASLLVSPTQSAESRYLAKEYAKYQVAFMAGLGVDKYAHRVIVHNQVTT